ncbi:hypothetical protein NITHO_6030002 [Nitrolancea hollandica Lb]|uniref:Uncharacterized protein n=1 Tax=Nitrolancea hollandica Lb TaxID=1129897 RepID=I4EMH3_9BACT|nr:hypothetical protein NITHO_6030002 [Nitrolancea hollandica Lb]
MTNTKANDYQSRKLATTMGLRNLDINETTCGKVVSDLQQARFRTDTNSLVKGPVHDATSHNRSAVEYFFVNVPPHIKHARPTAPRRKMVWEQF